MRGRLINPFDIEICRLDTVAIAAAPGFDPIWREPTLVSTADGKGASGRKEMTSILVPGQFTTDSDFLALQMAANGNLGRIDFKIIFHFSDLEDLGLIEASTGLALIRAGDRMSAVYADDGLTLVQAIPNPPGVFVKQADPRFGLGKSRNLLIVSFASRDQGQAASAGG